MVESTLVLDQLISPLTEIVRKLLGFELAFVSRIRGEDFAFRTVVDTGRSSLTVASGAELALGLTPCEIVVARGAPLAVADTTLDPLTKDHSSTVVSKIRSYVGVPIWFQDGELYGTLCCMGGQPVPSVAEADVRSMEQVAELIARILESMIGTVTDLAQGAFHDPLTGLANRALLTDRLEQLQRAARRRSLPVAAFVVDLDDFKPINDRHGHATGDAALQEVARRLRTAVRGPRTRSRAPGAMSSW